MKERRRKMCEEIYILLSTYKKDNEKLDKLLEPLKEKNVKITKGNRGQKLFSRDNLPFIQTDDGGNIYGLEEIEDFVKRELRMRKNGKSGRRKALA